MKTRELNIPEEKPIIIQCPNPKSEGKEIKHILKKGPLFPKPPHIQDIKQGGRPNCFFVSTIICILKGPHGENILQNIIYEKFGKIHVTFYDKEGKKNIISLKKSLPEHLNLNNKIFWAAFLEKAYAAFASNGDYKKFKNRMTFELLLGQIQTYRRMHHFLQYSHPSNAINVNDLFPVRKTVKSGTLPLSPEDKQIWLAFVQKAGGLASRWHSRSYKFKYHFFNSCSNNVLRFEDIYKFISDEFPKMTTEEISVAKKLLTQVDQAMILPGKRGTGRYSKNQLRIFDTIDNLLKNHFYIRAGTDLKIASAPKEEKRYQGLIRHHAYSILDCKTEKNLKWLLMHNPWGHTGRDYIEKAPSHLTPIETKNAEFWIELSDFTKRYYNITYGGCYLLSLDHEGLKQNIQHLPAYVIAKDGLYFIKGTSFKPNKITEKHRISISATDFELLKTQLFSTTDPVKKLNDKEQAIIKHLTGSTGLKEKYKEQKIVPKVLKM